MGREKDPAGDRLKVFERATEVVLDPSLPLILRLDGRSFHTWTRCFDRPYDQRLNDLMVATALAVAQEANARYVYTQSDEITLVCLCAGVAQPLFGGRVQKLTSLLAAYASAYFNNALPKYAEGAKPHKLATFDCRAYTVPDKATAVDVVLWREADAIRNSTLGRGQEVFSHRKLQGLSAKEVRQKLAELTLPWGELPSRRKFGAAFQRKAVHRRFRADEIETLPEKHAARTDPNLMVTRQDFVEVTLPLRWICKNPEAVIFDGADADCGVVLLRDEDPET